MPSNLYGPQIPGLTEQVENKAIADGVRNKNAIDSRVQEGVLREIEDLLRAMGPSIPPNDNIFQSRSAPAVELLPENIEFMLQQAEDQEIDRRVQDAARKQGFPVPNRSAFIPQGVR